MSGIEDHGITIELIRKLNGSAVKPYSHKGKDSQDLIIYQVPECVPVDLSISNGSGHFVTARFESHNSGKVLRKDIQPDGTLVLEEHQHRLMLDDSECSWTLVIEFLIPEYPGIIGDLPETYRSFPYRLIRRTTIFGLGRELFPVRHHQPDFQLRPRT